MSTTEKTPVWPGWETARLIGRGSFGAVYEIRRSVFGETERCALKYISIPQNDSEIRDMKSEGMDDKSITRSFEEQARDIVKEYRLMMQLNDSPNVVHCYDVESVQKDEGFGWDIYIRMELLTPLTVLLSRTKDWSEAETGRLARDIGTALRDCRRLNIVHRDVKPQNIFVSKDGRYKLGDFGIARISEMTGTATVRVGTYSTMAPEVFNGERYGAAADVYSLGMVLYWLLNERRGPFVSVNTAAEKNQALRRRMSGEALPAPVNGSAELKGIVLKCCAFDPKERYRSAEELLRDLENAELEYEEPTAYVGAIHESPADSGKRQFAPDDPQTSGPPVTSNAETADYTLGAGLGPGRGQGQTTEGAGRASPSPTREDAERTVSDHEWRKATAETGTRKTNKKKLILPACCAVAAIAVLLAFLLLPGNGKKAGSSTAPLVHTTPKPVTETLAPATPEPETPAPVVDENAAAYAEAEALAARGKTYEAALAFYAIKDYSDAWDRCFALWGQITQRETVSAGGMHTVALRTDGTVLAVGYNSSGQCDVDDWQGIVAVSAGYDHTAGLRADGTVVAVGANASGQCDVGEWQDIVAVSAGWSHTVGLRADGTVVAAGRDGFGQCSVSHWQDVVAISAGEDCTFGLRSDGTVISTGRDEYGRRAVEDWQNIVAISAGEYHTVGLRADGTVVAVGRNSNGECDVDGWRDIVAISAAGCHTAGLRSDGTVLELGSTSLNANNRIEVENWKDIVAASAGQSWTVGLRADGTVLAEGIGSRGQCNVSGWTDIALPEKRARN